MKIFIDTSAWLALNDRNDRYHIRAVSKSSEIRENKIDIVTSEYIIDESITLIRFRVSHKAAIVFGESIFRSNIVRIEGIIENTRLQAWEIFKKYRDKNLSFTDCTSFVIMKNLKIKKAFTFDEDFRYAGFEMF